MPSTSVRAPIVICLALFVGMSPWAARGGEAADSPVTPRAEPIALFNGKNLDDLYVFLKDTKHDDPRRVFTVQDGLLRISGDGLGAITTKKAYRDYHLVIEFQFPGKTWAPREEKARDSGVLVHAQGEDGAYSGTWMTSIEAQIIEGGCGDFIVVRGTLPDGTPAPISLSAETTTDRDGETVWKAGGEKKTLQRGRVNWYGRDPDWADRRGFRGKDDVESPLGKWTRMDVVCDGGRIANYVNGVKVNEAFDVSPSSGKIQLQTELAELWVRRWELWPLGKAPKFDAKTSR